jgi:hypothetical protein
MVAGDKKEEEGLEENPKDLTERRMDNSGNKIKAKNRP